MTLIEEIQAAAARRLADAVAQLEQANAEVKAAARQATDSGMSVNRIAGVVGVSRNTVYRWLRTDDDAPNALADTPSPKPAKKTAKKTATSRAKRAAHD